MNTRKILSSLVGLSLLSVACQKSPVGSTAVDDGNQVLNCKTGTEPVDPSQLEIDGNPVAVAGEKLSYTLNEDLSCSNSQKVVWRTVGASGAKVGSRMTSTFNKAGSYVVSAEIQSADTAETSVVSFKTTVVSNQMSLSGPDVGMAGIPVHFDLAVPAGMNLVSAEYNFGDASAVVNSLSGIDHTFNRAGTYQVSVVAKDDQQNSTTLSQSIQIVALQDGLECVTELAISSPAESTVGTVVPMSVFIPSCLTTKITSVHWIFGDGFDDSNQTTQHAYESEGNYTIKVELTKSGSTAVWATLTQTIHIGPMEVPTPTPTATPVVDPTPNPSPTPSQNPLACLTDGQTRDSFGEIYSETVACGRDGSKVMSYRDRLTEKCQSNGTELVWTEISRTKELQNEGSCQGQSCLLPDGSKLADGGKKVLYSSETPAGACSTVSQERVCSNGVLSGSDSYHFQSCHNGCDGFGSHGTTKTDIVTGEVNVPLTCAFGETGFFSIYNQVSDQVCTDGQVVTSNTHQGSIKTPGSCPTYSWVATDTWGACSADCGGKQTRQYVCQDNKGQVADSARCSGAAPVEERVCDGNPDAVRRQESVTTSETAETCGLCPKNQIGVVVNERDKTVTTTYACINHQVAVEGTATTYTPWVKESYCRDYVPHRCSQDSLNNTQAHGRYQWLLKCQDQVPAIKEFLTMFDDVKAKSSDGARATVDSSTRTLYPTFMNTATRPEKPWIAPTSSSASCAVPKTAYVAAVCVSSCATPEEQILANETANSKMKYVPFIEALTKNYEFVQTMQSQSSMSSKFVQKTKVDNWVTELLDTEHDIVVLKMKSGGVLKLTPNHPVVTSEGTMKEAGDFKVGESLVQLGGARDPIVSIEHVKYFGKVYNVFVKSAEVHKNIVVTNGYLNGTAFFQNEGAQNLNRVLFRDKLIKGVLDK